MGGCPKCNAPVGDTDFACRQCGQSFVADPSVARLDPYQSAFNSPPSQRGLPQPPPPPSTPFRHPPPPPPPPSGNSSSAFEHPPLPPPPPFSQAPNPYAPPASTFAPTRLSTGGLSASEEATKALNWALLGFFCFGFYFGFKAVGHGRRALKMFATQPAQMPGRQKAEIAIFIGYADIALWVVGILLQLAGRS